MQGLQAAMSQLKSSSEKLVNSKLALASLQQAAEGTRMLVPITSSLYVPGETTQLSNVLIDVGTGYYIEKSVDEAQAFLDRKIAMVGETIAGLSASMDRAQVLAESIDPHIDLREDGGAR